MSNGSVLVAEALAHLKEFASDGEGLTKIKTGTLNEIKVQLVGGPNDSDVLDEGPLFMETDQTEVTHMLTNGDSVPGVKVTKLIQSKSGFVRYPATWDSYFGSKPRYWAGYNVHVKQCRDGQEIWKGEVYVSIGRNYVRRRYDPEYYQWKVNVSSSLYVAQMYALLLAHDNSFVNTRRIML